MTKKGLGMVACLTVMSAAAAWATSMYSIQTKLTNGGGSVQVRNYNAQTLGGSIKYTNFTTQGAVQVMVTPDSLHKISALTQNGSTVDVGDGNSPVAVNFYKNGPTTHETQSLVATFAVKSAGNVYLKSWQLQTRNNNAGGTITTTRGTDAANTLTTSGTTVLKNYPDTTPVTVKVVANAGYSVKSVSLNGAAVALDGNGQFTINPAAGGRVNSVQAVYQKIAYTVSGGAGILPASTGTTYGGTVKLNVTPAGVNNVVTGVTVTGTANVLLTDALGNVVTAPLNVQGPVKVTLSNIQSNVSVAATYRNDPTKSDLQSCTTSCHLAASDAVKAVPSQWTNSMHYKSGSVGCTTCHNTMPGGVVRESVDAKTFQVTNASAGTVGAYYCTTCHSNSPVTKPQVADAVNTWHSQQQGGANACSDCHGTAHEAKYDPQAICSQCHSGEANDFFVTSPHWNNLRNDGDSAVVGDGAGSCATNKCHFRPTTNAKVACAACHSDGGANNGGDHAAPNGSLHAPQAVTMEDSCWACHEGSHHGTPTAQYQKSAHYLNPYYMYGDKEVVCQDCHNPHSTKAAFPGYDKTTYAKDANAPGACDKCHARTPGKPYGIFSSNGQMVAPHAQTVSAKSTADNSNYLHGWSANPGWYSSPAGVTLNVSSSYVTPNNTCSDCHGHNNYINAEYADTMHADPNGRWKAIDGFKFAGYSSNSATTYTPATVKQDGCVRCHTTTGFVNYVQSGYQDLRAWGYANKADQTGEVITCRACHVTTAGAITGEAEVALPEGNVNGWNPKSIRAYNAPYTAYYNYSVAKVKKFVTAAAYRDFKNSNICIPCHSGRNGATNGAAIKSLGAYANYTTLTFAGTAGQPHGVYQAAVLDAKLGYNTFAAATGKKFVTYTTAANGHANIGVTNVQNTGNSSGPCVTCHMDFTTQTGEKGKTATYRKHEFSIVKKDGSLPTVCANCHSNNFKGEDLDAAKANFQASVIALAEIMKTSNNIYGKPLVTGAVVTQYGTTSYKWSWADSKRGIAGVSFTGKSAQFADLNGAMYNLQFLWGVAFSTTDEGAYAHNPQYLKQLVFNTIEAMRATTTASVGDAINQLSADVVTDPAVLPYFPGFDATKQAAAAGYLTNANNHYASGAVRIQYVASNTQCASCHNQNETELQKSAREAWAESAHGSTTGPWSNHDTSSTTPYDGAAIASNTTDPCIRCHVSDGFIQFTDNGNYSNVNALTRADAKSVYTPLNCNTCHVSGLTDDNARRNIAKVQGAGDGVSGIGSVAYYNYSGYDLTNKSVKLRSRVAANYPDVKDSNLCIPCHSGHSNTGKNVADVTATPGFTFTNASQFKAASMAPVAGMMYNKLGFINFTTNNTQLKSLQSSIDGGSVTSTHRLFGTTGMYGDSHSLTLFGTKTAPVTGNMDQGGPCVTCHVRGNFVGGTPRGDAGHSFEISKDAFLQVCSNCHTSENGNEFNPKTVGADAAWNGFQSHFLEPNAEVYVDAQTLAKYFLKKNFGIKMSGSTANELSTGVAVKDWTRGGQLSNAQAAKLMGAVFNVGVFGNEPAAYAHARTYTRRLMYDTLDFLDDGIMNGSVGASAIAASQAPADADFNVAGKYVKDSNGAYNIGVNPDTGKSEPTTIYGTTSEDMIFILGWSRTTGAWSSPERP